MPKLKSVHLSRVGHPSARLDGVSIYFTAKGNPFGRPQESTILALRNGGGKTSLLQLLFSTFVPDKREFSGRTSEGGERSFDQYFQPNDLGLIVTEWDLGENMPTRVVGQCVVKANISDTNPQQCFFSFLVTDQESDFQVSNLPMRQFKDDNNSGNASSFSAFKQLLRSDFVTKPHQQLIITETQKEWLKSLRSWGYEPDIFRLLISLNRSEGGSKEMAKDGFGTTEKMIGLIATLSMSEQDRKKGKGTGNIHDLISKYREDLVHLPEKEAEKKMWEQLSAAMTGLIIPGQELVQAQEDKKETFSKLSVVGRKVLASPAVFQEKITAEKDEISLLENLQEEKNGHIQTLEKKKNWIDREILRWAFAAAQKVAEETEINKNTSHQYCWALEAHNIKRAITSFENQRQGLRASITAATEPTRDIEETLHALGSQLKTLFKKQIAAATIRKKDAAERCGQADGILVALRQEETTTNISKGTTTEQRKNIDQWFDDADKERSKLPLHHRLAAEVVAEADTQRLANESALDLLQQEGEQLNEQKILLYGAQKDAAAELHSAEKILNQHKAELVAFKLSHQKIASDEDLCLLFEDEEIDPYSLTLPRLLDEKRFRLENEKFNLTIDQRRSRESMNFLEGDYNLMPPPEDIWCVCETLKNEDIQAYPYVKYLSENNFAPERIRELLAQDPARYGGVCIMHSKDLHSAMEIVGNLGSLRGPVQVYPLDKHAVTTISGSICDSAVALPASDATFSLAGAAAEQRKLSSEISDRDDSIEEIKQRISIITLALNRLSRFLDRFPDGTDSDLQLKEQVLAASIESVNEKLTVTTRNFEEHTSGAEENAQQQKDMQGQVETSKDICHKLQNYITQFEQLFSVKEKEQQTLCSDLEAIKLRLVAINQELVIQNHHKQEAERACTSMELLITEFTKRKDELNYTDSVCGKIPSSVDPDSIDGIQSLYLSLKKTFEEKNASIAGLLVQVDSLKERISEQEKALGRYQVDTIPEDVFGRILNQYGENTVDESSIKSALDLFEDNNKKATLAENESKRARSKIDNFPFSLSQLLEPEESQQLKDVADCNEKKAETIRNVEKMQSDSQALSDRISGMKGNIVALEQEIKYIQSLIATVKGKTSPTEGQISATGYHSYQEALDGWSIADRTYSDASKTEQAKVTIVNGMKSSVLRVLGDERFARIANIIRQRINAQMETLHLDAASFAQEAQNALDSVEYTLSKTKEQQREIVDYLLDDVRTVKSNLDALDRISIIPETDTKWSKWSGRKFFKVKIDGKRLEDGYCWTKIEEYIQKLVKGNEKSFPVCAQDIIEGVAKFALKDIINITTMKPDHFMSTNPETLEEAARWSGGEGFTYAAVSLMVFNQLICHINASVNLAGGILVVDNPIGICNHLEFIKLQQIMANILDNQLIYPTAVKDFDALSLFPNVVTLSNNRVDAKTGFKHVRVENHSHNVPEISSVHMTFTPEVVNAHTETN